LNGDLVGIRHPTPGWAWWSVVTTVFIVLLGGFCLAWITSRVWTSRQSTGRRRQRLRCLLFGIVAAVLGVAGGAGIDPSGGPGQGVAGAFSVFAWLGLPISIGVGVLEYRLCEIDRLTSRTLSYTLLTGALAGVFVGLVLLTTRVLPLVAAGLFSPLRVRLQRLVDRRFNRNRYDAEALLAAFGGRLRVAVDLDTVRSSLLDAAGDAVEPRHVSLWLRGSPERRRQGARVHCRRERRPAPASLGVSTRVVARREGRASRGEHRRVPSRLQPPASA